MGVLVAGSLVRWNRSGKYAIVVEVRRRIATITPLDSNYFITSHQLLVVYTHELAAVEPSPAIGWSVIRTMIPAFRLTEADHEFHRGKYEWTALFALANKYVRETTRVWAISYLNFMATSCPPRRRAAC